MDRNSFVNEVVNRCNNLASSRQTIRNFYDMQMASNNTPDIEEAIAFVNIQRKASKLAFLQ